MSQWNFLSGEPDRDRRNLHILMESIADLFGPRGLDELTPAADLYGLGATLFHMLTGTPPFAGDSREAVVARHLTEPAASVKALEPELGDPTAAVVARCLEKAPGQRFESAAALLSLIHISEPTRQ